MRRVTVILIVAAMLVSASGPVAHAQPNAAPAPVILDAKGWSDPTVGSWDGATATLHRDLSQGIKIEVPNVVLDGAGHTLTGGGKGSGNGVYASQQWGLTIRNLRVTNFDTGIYLNKCGGATLTGNTLIANAYDGIFVTGGSRHVLTGNTASNNGQAGIHLASCPWSTLAGNTMADNAHNFWVDGNSATDYDLAVDASNTVQGRPVLYLVGANGASFDASSNVGTVYLVNCSGITVKGLELTRNFVGVLLWNTGNSRLEGLRMAGNVHGVWLRGGSSGNTLQDNIIEGSKANGIYLEGSDGNTLVRNEVRSSGGVGLNLVNASNNRAHGNRFLENRTHAYGLGGGGNIFNQPKPEGGNYWDDWTVPDGDGDGFVDNPRVFSGGRDEFPVSGLPKADTVPPVTAAVLDGQLGGDGWYRSDVRVVLAAIDNEGGSGVKSTQYSFDGGGSWQPYIGPFMITSEGTTALAFRSLDNAGNLEQVRRRDVRIDKTAPEISITQPQPGEVVLGGTAVSFGARDALSGLAGVSGSLFDGSNRWSVSSGDTVSEAGVYNLTVLADDVAGNTGSLTHIFVVPTLAAASVTGGGWFSVGDGKSAADKAFVNVVCQNHKLPAIPVGEFSFRVGDLSLKGTGYRWLVIRGNLAWLEGTGTIHGSGNYRFQFIVQEGNKASEPDRVRVRIWDQAVRLIYDSQPGAGEYAGPTGSLSGGNITIHKG